MAYSPIPLSANNEAVVTFKDLLPVALTITAQDIASTSAAGQNGQSIITGTPTAASNVTQAITGDTSFSVQVTGTWTGTLQFERSLDGGTTYTAIGVFSAGTSYTTQTITSNGAFHGNASSATNIRVRATTAWTGTASVKILAGAGTGTITVGNPIRLFDSVSGTTVGNRADGYMNVRPDPTTLLFDTFETLDTTNTWTVSGTTAPSGSLGSVTANPGTVASGTSLATSKPTFTPGSSAYLQYAAIVQIESAVITGAVRFWGLGILNGTPTTTAPITNGSIFEVGASDGLLYGRVYSGGAVTQSVALTRPTDAGVHRYQITYKASRVYYNIDNVEVGSLPFPNPQVAALATVFGTVNGGTALTTATSTSLTLVGIADTGKNASQLADGTYPWRKAQVSATGAQKVDGSAVTQPVSGTFFQATQPISATALPLPTGAATDATQTNGTAQSKITDGTNVANVLSATGTAASQASQLVAGSYREMAALTAGALNADLVVSTDVSNYKTWSLQISGTYAGTISFQGSNDNTNFLSVTALNITGATSANNLSTTTTGLYQGDVTFRYLRVRMTAYTSGTATGVLELYSQSAQRTALAANQSGTWTVGANSASGSAVPASVFPIGIGDAIGNLTTLRVSSTYGDATTLTQGLPVNTFPWNGTNYDRLRNNINTTTGDTGAKTASFAGATQTNYNHDGASITVLCGTVSGTTPTLTAQLQWSPDGGTTWLALGPVSTAVTATGNTITMMVYPTNHSVAGATPAALTTGATTSVMLNTILPRTWRLNYTIGGTTPSFAITGVYVNSVM